MAEALTITGLNQYIKSLMDGDAILTQVLVQGEASGYRVYPSGHHYFTLKDSESTLKCVMFRGDASRLKFRPQDGMALLASGRVTVYPRDGQYQMYCTRLQPDGIGSLAVAFEQLKERLAPLFAMEHKKTLPPCPNRVALLTSPVGAAVQDMIRILGQRFPLCEVVVVPTRVQGAEAPDEIAAGLRYINRHYLADVIITGRGGGSMEDLWAFNEEVVARAIYQSEIPVVSAVGHEPDFTIADFVADARAATPTHAAELVVPDGVALRQNLTQCVPRMQNMINHQMESARRRLEVLRAHPLLTNPTGWIEQRQLGLDRDAERLTECINAALERRRRLLAQSAAQLDALSPLATLSRGYSLATRADGCLASAQTIRSGDEISLRFPDGSATATVKDVQVNGKNKNL